MKFHHVGIACEHIEETLAFLRSTHQINSVTETLFDSQQQANVCMVNVEDGLNIELISGKPVENLLKKKIILYHTCYEVADLEAALAKFETAGAMILSGPKPAVLFDNRRVAFVHTTVGIVEFVESAK